MKIVQSLWSRPGNRRDCDDNGESNACGWADKRYHYFSWALSALQLRKFYDELELVTDEQGYELLIEKIGLPYTNVEKVLDKLNHYHQDLFSAGKLYAYSIQNRPFIHVDSDVFIWSEFDTQFCSKSLLCQSPEQGAYYNKLYTGLFDRICHAFKYCPETLVGSIGKNGEIRSINAGVIGGSNIDFFRRYTAKAFEFIDRNVLYMSAIDVTSSNQVFEQFMFRALAEELDLEISYLFEHMEEDRIDIVDLTGVPGRNKYIHLYSGYKKVNFYLDNLEYRLQKEHPDYYFRIQNLLRTNQI
jgi:hypothetical protein